MTNTDLRADAAELATQMLLMPLGRRAEITREVAGTPMEQALFAYLDAEIARCEAEAPEPEPAPETGPGLLSGLAHLAGTIWDSAKLGGLKTIRQDMVTVLNAPAEPLPDAAPRSRGLRRTSAQAAGIASVGPTTAESYSAALQQQAAQAQRDDHDQPQRRSQQPDP